MWQFLTLLGTTLLVTGGLCEPDEVVVGAGSQAVLPCFCRPTSNSAAAIHWSKSIGSTVWRKQKSGVEFWGPGTAKRVQCPHSEVGMGDYSLYIKEAREEDGGEYNCRVKDREQLVHKKIMLRVIKVSVSPPVLVEGSKVSIACNVTPWPKGATVSWRFNGKNFLPENLSVITETYLQGKASLDMTGDWTCVVRYKTKEENSTQALTVRGIVNPSSDSASVYAEVGTAVILPCVFSASLTPFNPEWERLNEGSNPLPLPLFFNLSSLSFWDRSVHVGEVVPAIGGRYRCSGTVDGSRLAREVQLVTAQVLSDTPSTQRAPVTLTCHLSNASEVTDYEWVKVTYALNGTQSVIPVQKGKVMRITDETEKNSGEWACRFYGKQGILGNATYHRQLMSGLTGENMPEASNNTATVIGLVFLLLVLLLVLVQMYKNHQRRRRILRYPALETISHAISNEREDRERNRVKDEEVA